MFPRTTNAGTALVTSTKAKLVRVFSSSEFEPEIRTESASEYRTDEQAKIYRQEAGIEMTSNESDKALEREIQICHVDRIENENKNETPYLTSGDEPLVFEI